MRFIIFRIARLMAPADDQVSLGFIDSQGRYYRALKRSFRYGRSHGPWWDCQTSTGQGCAISQLFINLSVAGWVWSVTFKNPAAQLTGLIDDRTLRHK